jgi:hypothetical protein
VGGGFVNEDGMVVHESGDEGHSSNHLYSLTF